MVEMASNSKAHITEIIPMPTKITKHRLKGSTPVTTITQTSKTYFIFSLHKWVINYNATDHMTSNPNIFANFR